MEGEEDEREQKSGTRESKKMQIHKTKLGLKIKYSNNNSRDYGDRKCDCGYCDCGDCNSCSCSGVWDCNRVLARSRLDRHLHDCCCHDDRNPDRTDCNYYSFLGAWDCDRVLAGSCLDRLLHDCCRHDYRNHDRTINCNSCPC
jgi:hypothetical protein